jgi:hypothetical protein
MSTTNDSKKLILDYLKIKILNIRDQLDRSLAFSFYKLPFVPLEMRSTDQVLEFHQLFSKSPP